MHILEAAQLTHLPSRPCNAQHRHNLRGSAPCISAFESDPGQTNAAVKTMQPHQLLGVRSRTIIAAAE
eukprot:365734-Chlamydomonas_euryale.AAC.26